ncbi:asparagine synthase-related protein [Francisella frigiditurris]|uniref:asparagine synthase (glutamine-hydrolyzing) n=1 Tax=Francisella frigiditurris TaxID=1542390 RepID=A0A1J0KTC2_9GAMM|nr:asparagine synthase-related protein [Francisella frigiditurris]APC96939.1 glutamine amidotransferase domain protein [Francisella frigiditurris]
MFHGIFFRTNNLLGDIQEDIIDGSNKILNTNPENKTITTLYDYESGYWLSQAIEKNSRELIYSYKNFTIVGWIKLYNREELITKLEISPPLNTSDAELILYTYEKYVDDTPEHLHGDYSFAIFDNNNKKLLCVRDHMGTRPFYYYLDDNVFIFSSSQVIFNYLDILNISASEEWICRVLDGGTNMNFEKTAYNEVFKIPPAHYLNISKENFLKKKYFEFSTKKINLNANDDYFKIYEEKVKKAILERFINSNHNIGSEISGGIDSSTVTSYIAKYFDQPINNLFTYGFTRLDQEPEYALLVNQFYKLPNAFICSGNSNIKNKNPLDILGAPVEHGNATGHEIFYLNASGDGVRSLFSGFGGDEFVTSIHGDLVKFELLKDRRYKDLFKTFGGNIITKPLRILKFLVQNNAKRGKKSFGMLNAFKSRWPYFLVKDDFIEKHDLKQRYFEVGSFDNGFSSFDKFTLEKRWVSFVPTRMDNCSLMAAAYGIDYYWPLLDVHLIQFFLSTPNTLKIHKGFGRYLHRKSVEDTVPKKIIWKKSKYMGEPFLDKRNNEADIEFDNNLHPDLINIINIEKLHSQLEKLKTLDNAKKEIKMTISRNISNIKNIDEWLKYFNLRIK